MIVLFISDAGHLQRKVFFKSWRGTIGEDASVSNASLVQRLPLEHIPETNLCMAMMHVPVMSILIAERSTTSVVCATAT